MIVEEMAGNYDCYFKVVIIGDAGVGKSSLQIRYKDNTFSERYIRTIGIEFLSKILSLDGKLVKLQLWDTAGEERFRMITRSFYRGARGIIIVFDVTNQKSFDSINGWVDSVEKWTDGNVNILLVGNKCDLTEDRVVHYDTAKSCADQLGIPLIETSAKDAVNVEQAFVTIAAAMKMKSDLSMAADNRDKVRLSSETPQTKPCW